MAEPSGMCTRCGCTEGKACLEYDGQGNARPCGWATSDTCTACVGSSHLPAGPRALYVARPRGIIIYGPDAARHDRILLKELTRQSRWLAKARKGLRAFAAYLRTVKESLYAEKLERLADSIDGRKVKVRR